MSGVPRDVVAETIAFEEGLLTPTEVISFFQYLIDTGLVWSLQGTYGRTASLLISSGQCTPGPKPA